MRDVAIIGAGIAGTYIARELARYDLDIVLIDKENDLANATTMANSAVIHAGYDAKPGTLMSRYNVAGNAMFDAVCEELDVPFKRIGSMVLAFSEADEARLSKLYEQGLESGVPDMQIISGEEVRRMEPNVSEQVTAALLAGTAGIVSPYELAIALGENAVDNGASLCLDTEVTDIVHDEEGYNIVTTKGHFKARYIINCAGVYADKISAMVGDTSYTITPRKGHYYVMDKPVGALFHHVLFQCPSDKGKGVLITPTVHGNVLIGPDAQFVADKGDLGTDREHLMDVQAVSRRTSEKIPFDQVIRSFVGLRASTEGHDFIIGESSVAPNFIQVGGFESPGLSSIPAVALDVVAILKAKEPLEKRQDFNPRRRPVIKFMALPDAQKSALIQKDSRYGNMICRCEGVTEGEIVDCIHRSAGATTVKGVKKRTRPGMGRCQGGFCGPRVVEILSRELKLKMADVAYDSPEGYILTGATKKEGLE